MRANDNDHPVWVVVFGALPRLLRGRTSAG